MDAHALLVCLATVGAALSIPAAAQTAHSQHHPTGGVTSMLMTPRSIAAEHRELHETLELASKETGTLGAAARELEATLAPHFRREEEIATPPLGLLPKLATGEVTSEMKSVLPMTQALERELPQMLKEHQAIRAAVGKFRAAAETAKRPDYVRFSDALSAHARQEEEILYPAAILVGRYVATKTSH
jgi:hemerythrin HHE cation binding domain-containing protein